MFENRRRTGGEPDTLPRIEPEESEDTPPLFGRLLADDIVRRALMVVPVAVVGFCLVWWFASPEPPQSAAPAPAVATRLEPQQPVEPPAPAMPPAPAPVEVKATTPLPPAAPAVVPPSQPAPDLRPLNREEIKELQGKLGAIGFATGPADGVVGPQTQAALRRYGEARNIKPEANREVLSRVRSEAADKP